MPHVLIVDDELNIRRVLAAMLKREGYDVTTAADGEQALGVLQKTPIHVVVTDLVIVGRTNRAALRAGAVDGGVSSVIVVKDRSAAVTWVREHLGSGDTVLYENDLPDHYP